MLQRLHKALENNMELEYDSDLDEYRIIIPESMVRNLDWEEGDMLDYDLDDEILRIFKI
jgi:hypothetical protein